MGPFELYTTPEGRKAERALRKVWRQFLKEWQKARADNVYGGAEDTASREAQVRWIEKHAKDVY